MQNRSSIIKFQNVSVKFKNKSVFTDLNFEIKKGEKVVFYGESGIGKTTIFNLILGFIKPQTGSISFSGSYIDEKTVWEIRKKVSYVSQNSDISEIKVREFFDTVLSFKNNAHIYNVEEDLKKLLSYFKLNADILQENFEKLSGGEKQRLSIILSLLLKKEIFLLDEPTSALDSHLKEKVIDMFTKNENWTVIIISHDKDWLKNERIRKIDI